MRITAVSVNLFVLLSHVVPAIITALPLYCVCKYAIMLRQFCCFYVDRIHELQSNSLS